MMERDRNLVFAILAVQIKGVPPSAIVEAGAVWTTQPSRSLSELLVERGALSQQDRTLLEGLVDEAVRAHSGDAAKALESFGGQIQVEKTFSGSVVLSTEDGIETIKFRKGPYREETVEEFNAVIETPGRYSRISEHARGGMGRVLLVHDEHLGRDIALKELLVPGITPEAGDTPVRHAMAMTARFLQEARVTGQLEHPSIVPVYELGRRQDGSLYYTMKLVRGKSLFRAIRDCAGLPERLGLLPHFIDLCNAIAYAHSRGIIHRDVKPDNVMVGEFGETVVLDWGIAKALGRADYNEDRIRETLLHLRLDEKASSAQTAAGMVLGTPNYMAPEQADGRITDVDQRSDIYSLGAVLYELLTGNPPFASDLPSVVLKQVISETPPAVLSAEPDAPPELAVICQTAMQKDPAARYQSAKELAAEVIRFQTGAFVKAYTYRPWDVFRRYYRRYRAVINTAAAGVCALVLLGVYSHVSLSRAYDREQAQRQVADDGKYATQLHLVSAQMAANNYELARSTLWATDESRRNWEWGYLVHRCNVELLTLPDRVGATYSPDGARIATISRNKPIEVFDAAQDQLLVTISEHVDRPLDIRYSLDGKWLAAPSLDQTVEVWDAQTGKLLHALTGAARSITAFAFAPGGAQLAASSLDGAIHIWDISTGQLSKMFAAHDGGATGVTYSPDGKALLTSGLRGPGDSPGDPIFETKVWNLPEVTERFTVAGKEAVWNAQSTAIAVTEQFTVSVYDAASGKPAGSLRGHDGYVRTARFTPDGARLVTAADDGVARVYDSAGGKPPLLTLQHGGQLTLALPCPNGKYILTASRDGSMKVWDAAGGRLLSELDGHANTIRSAEFSPDSSRVLSGSFDQNVKVWSATQSLASSSPIIYQEGPQAAALSLDGSYAAFVLPNKTVEVRKTGSGAAVAGFAAYAYRGGTCASISPDNQRLAVALDGFTPLVWDVSSSKLLSKLAGHRGRVESVSFGPDGRRILTTSWDNTAKVWDSETGAELLALVGHTNSVLCGAFSPDGARIATGSSDLTVRVWDAKTGQVMQTYQGHTGRVTAVAFDTSGALLASASDDKSIRVWSGGAQQGNVRVFEGHERGARAVAFSPDGSRLASGATDGSLKVWNARTGAELIAMRGHSTAALRVAFVDGAQGLISVSSDGTLRNWRAAPWRADAWSGDPKMSMAERFQTYRKTAQKPVERAGGGLAQIAVAVTPEMSHDALTRLGAAIEKTAATANPSVAVEGETYNALAKLCVLRGDELTAIDGAGVTSGETVSRAALALAQRISADPNAKWSLSLRRKGTAITHQFVSTPRVEQTVESSLALADAKAFFDSLTDRLRRFAGNTLEQNRLRAADIGAPGTDPKGLGGIWLLDGADGIVKQHSLTIGIADEDRVMQVNGQLVSDFASLARQIEDLASACSRKEPVSLAMEVERGRFVINHIRVTVR